MHGMSVEMGIPILNFRSDNIKSHFVKRLSTKSQVRGSSKLMLTYYSIFLLSDSAIINSCCKCISTRKELRVKLVRYDFHTSQLITSKFSLYKFGNSSYSSA